MRLRSFLRPRVYSPTSIAAYLTWATVAYALWREPPQWPTKGSIPSEIAVAMPMTLFLLALVLRNINVGAKQTAVLNVVAVTFLVGSTFDLLVLGPQLITPVLLIILAVVLVASFTLRTAWSILLMVNAVFLGILEQYWQLTQPLFIFLIYGCFQVFAAVTTHALVRAEATADALRRTNAELIVTRSLLAESARDGERLRVSRELHDVAGHKLTALALNLDVLLHDADAAERRELTVVRQLTSELLSDVRSVVSRLRNDDGVDLQETLRQVINVFPKPAVHLSMDNSTRAIDTQSAEVMVRIAQEALTNAVRHSDAGNIWLLLKLQNEVLELLIEDDGRFSGQYTVGHGLLGMSERLAQLGGILEIGVGARGGFRIAAQLPQRRLP